MINVTAEDKVLEQALLNELCVRYQPLQHFIWKQTEGDTSIFDFNGFFLDVCRCRLDVKTLYSDPEQYPSNIFSIEKLQEYIDNSTMMSYYMFYYYPRFNFARLYELDKCQVSTGHARIWHRREKQTKVCEVAFIKSAQAIQSFKDFNNEEIKNALKKVSEMARKEDSETGLLD